MKRYIIFVLCLICYFSCKPEPEELHMKAEQEFQRLKLIREKELWLECRNNIIREAEIIVDSIMFEWNINPLGDDKYKPAIPNKPKFIETDTAILNQNRRILPLELVKDSTLIEG